MSEIRLSVSVHGRDLATELVAALDYDELIDHVLAIDSWVGEWDFTSRLYARLGDVLREGLEDGTD